MRIKPALVRWLLGVSLGAGSPSHAADLTAVVNADDGKPVAEAVLVAVPGNGSYPAAATAAALKADETMDQVNKEFVPLVEPIFVGSAVHFPNKDNIRHQVYSFSPAKRFELPLYAGTPAKPVVFDKPGVVTLGCNIHDWMIGYIYVSESPWFAKTDANGKATIRDLPPGQYDVRIWHPRMTVRQDATARPVTFADQTVTLNWTLSMKESEIRPRRAPIPGTGGYR